MNKNLKIAAASVLAASMVEFPLPRPPVESILSRKPSGKNREKTKAARKQRQKQNRKR
jgi:hypothetical protein